MNRIERFIGFQEDNMYLFMLDVDGTLLEQDDFECFNAAVESVLGFQIQREAVFFSQKTDINMIEKLLQDQDLTYDKFRLVREIKAAFLTNLRHYVAKSPKAFSARKGAIEFIKTMQKHPAICVSIVTGGWREAALIKLRAAGIDINPLILSSCSDASTKSEIMALSAFRAKQDAGVSFTRRFYFGDGEWDKIATQTLGYEFIAVGNNVKHPIRIQNFSHYQAILGKLGLSELLQTKDIRTLDNSKIAR